MGHAGKAGSEYAAITGTRFIARLVAVVALFNLLLFMLTGWWLYQNRFHYEERTEIATRNIAEVLNESIAGLIDAIDITLIAVANEIKREKAYGHADAGNIKAFLELYRSRLPEKTSLSVSNQSGITEYSTGVVVNRDVSVADREYFRKNSESDQAGLVIAGPIKGRTNGTWVLVLSRRINNPDGSFGGVIRASIDVDYFAEIFSALDIGPRGVITFRNSDFENISRYSKFQGTTRVPIGDKTVPKKLGEMIAAGQYIGTYHSPGGPDLIERIVSFHKIRNHDLYIIAGLAVDDYLERWKIDVMQMFALVAMFALITIFAGWLEYRGWKNRNIAARTIEHATALYTSEIGRAKDRAEATQRELQAILSAAGEGITGVDHDGRITFINQSGSQMVGWNQDDLIGREQHETIHFMKTDGTPYPREECPILKVLEDHKTHHIMKDAFCRKDGTIFPVEYTAAPIEDGVAATGLVVIFRDISERIGHENELMQARDIAEHANLAKSQFLATMSHELRTPLHTILGFSEMMLNPPHKGHPVSERCIEYVGDIYASATHLLNVINDVLDISKIEAGRLSIEQSIISTEQMIHSVSRLITERAHKSGIFFNIEISPNTPDLWADERAIKQILFNLLSNAIKFTSSGGKITLTAVGVEGGVNIAVGDTGVGIPTDQMDRVLKPFEQLDNRYSRSEGGTGLGLSVVQGLVKLHGGHLTIQSTVGQGSIFTVYLPSAPI